MDVHYQIWLKFSDGGERIIEDVEEFEAGFGYFYVRCYDGFTKSFRRDTISNVKRRTGPKRGWISFLLRKPKVDYGTQETEKKPVEDEITG